MSPPVIPITNIHDRGPIGHGHLLHHLRYKLNLVFLLHNTYYKTGMKLATVKNSNLKHLKKAKISADDFLRVDMCLFVIDGVFM